MFWQLQKHVGTSLKLKRTHDSQFEQNCNYYSPLFKVEIHKGSTFTVFSSGRVLLEKCQSKTKIAKTKTKLY